jgi:hypothetical protein
LLLLFSLGLGLFTGLVGAFLELWFFASWGVVLMNAEPGQGALAQLRVGLAVLAVNVIANPRYFHGPPLADNWGYRACAVLLVTGAAFEGVLLASTLVSPRFLARRP